jgi:NAD-dependent SIR2 family protein deacetylase
MPILSPDISKNDVKRSKESLDRLFPYLRDTKRSLVFFIGAGASMAGNTGMPSTPNLIYRLLLDSLVFSKVVNERGKSYQSVLKDISTKLGFEITLNDFWQICHEATSNIYLDFAELETQCKPNRVHTFLGHWLATGGSVVTTNYDRLIEQEWAKITNSTKSLYQSEGKNSFSNWQGDLQNGGCLFKIHGSLDEASSCLGALEHVGTQLTGDRAELLAKIIQTRPVCFVGWRGVDPDIPPLLRSVLEKRNSSLPIFWIHYEGWPPGSATLDEAIDEMTDLIRPLASQYPILTDADRAFGGVLSSLGKKRKENPSRKPLAFDFQNSVSKCSMTGVTRMVGIALRRAGEFDIAEHVLNAALSLAGTNEEQSAALQELSLLHQQIGGRKTDKSRRYLSKARKALGSQPDPWLQLNTDFGILSQSIVALKNRPWLLLRIQGQFRQYRMDIELFRQETDDQETAALHEALYYLYQGRLRFKVFGWISKKSKQLSNWIIAPFDISRSVIVNAKDIHIHSKIDVLAYRIVALAYLGHCNDAKKDLLEIDRLIAIFNDGARTKYWQNQKKEIIAQCKTHRIN